MDFVRSWSNCIMITAILITIVEMIVPEGEIKKVVILITGLIASITIATPIISFITDDFDLSQILKVEDYISDIEYSSSHNSLILGQINMLESEYAKNILKKYNENYPNEKIDSCRVIFRRDTEGKIDDIEKIIIKVSNKDINETKKKISGLSEIDESKIEVITDTE